MPDTTKAPHAPIQTCGVLRDDLTAVQALLRGELRQGEGGVGGRPRGELLAADSVVVPVETELIGTEHLHGPGVVGAVSVAAGTVVVRRVRIEAAAVRRV